MIRSLQQKYNIFSSLSMIIMKNGCLSHTKFRTLNIELRYNMIYRKRKIADKTMKKSQRNAKNRRNRNTTKCPVEIGNDYEVDITETAPNGAGIARIKGFLVLVNDTKPGDHLKVTITKTEPLNAEAEIVK